MSLYQCRPMFPDQNWWKGYNVYLTIIQYFVPVFIVDGAYTVIAVKVGCRAGDIFAYHYLGVHRIIKKFLRLDFCKFRNVLFVARHQLTRIKNV